MRRTMPSHPPSLTEVDRLVHEPSRSIILAILAATTSADFLYLQRETGLTKGNLTIHLSKLEKAGYLHIEKTYQGKTPLTLCRITNQGRAAFESYRKQLIQFIEDTSQPQKSLGAER
jgi:DNA-binding MarR family transcriptional regulator